MIHARPGWCTINVTSAWGKSDDQGNPAADRDRLIRFVNRFLEVVQPVIELLLEFIGSLADWPTDQPEQEREYEQQTQQHTDFHRAEPADETDT